MYLVVEKLAIIELCWFVPYLNSITMPHSIFEISLVIIAFYIGENVPFALELAI